MSISFPPAGIIIENLGAVALVWLWAILAGAPFLALLRVPLSRAATPIIGLAVWACGLYVLPFAGGQDVCLFLIASCGTIVIFQQRIHINLTIQKCARTPTFWLMAIYFVSLHTLTFCNYVTIGMDSTMHATSARLIAEHHGLPRDHAPFAHGLPLPAVNLGLPTLAAAAVRCGVSPIAATLACVPFTYFCFSLALYVFVRPWVPRFGAACLGIYGFIGSRELQETVYWGGFPTVAGFAVGILAGRVLYDLARRPGIGGGLVAGLLVSAIPLVHGISGAVWAYVCCPLVVIVGSMRVRRFRPALIAAGVTVLTTCLLFGCYVVFAKTEMTDAARTWTRNYQAGFAPKGEGSELLQSAYTNMLRSAGDEHAGAYLLGVLFLIVRWRLRQALFLLFGALLIYGIVLNSVFWFLPGSVALYPERAPYLINALSMLSLALAWHALPLWSRRLKRGWGMLGILLVCVGLLKYIPCYQRCVTHQALPPEQPYETSYPLIGAAEYESLIWCRNHLHAGQDMVQARYNSVGSYLPSVAGIATSAWHIHCFVIPYEQKILADRHPTHRLIVLSKEGEPTVGSGTEVFRNSAIVILRLW